MNLPRFSVRNPVAVNLLMWSILLVGLYAWSEMPREFFPNIEPEKVYITVPYPGATPAEIEKSVTRRIEREIEDVDEIEKIESKVLEGATVIVVTLEDDANRDRVVNDLRTEIDKVERELPSEVDDVELVEVRPFIPVISVVAFGDVSEERLRETVRDVRDDLLEMDEISEVMLSGLREKEIWIEVEPALLEAYGVTFEEVGRAVARTNLDMPGGQVRTSRGNIRVRTMGESDRAAQLRGLILRSQPDGSTVALSDVATIRETFEDKIERGGFQGKLAASVAVFKSPEEDALKISERVKAYIASRPERLGGAIKLQTTTDLSRFISQRIDLMVRNARAGIILVVLALAFFLNVRVAFWVAMGLPVSFLGTFALMRWFDVSINLISLFSLIIVLGMIVDDAIVVGESIFTRLRRGEKADAAAELGACQVATPVVAAVATTIAAFVPLAFVSGQMGNFLVVIPKVVIVALFVSLIEVFLILPAHLAHRRSRPSKVWLPRLRAQLDRLAAQKHRLLESMLPNLLERLLRFVLHWRYVTCSFAVAVGLATVGIVAAGIVPFVLIQDGDAENISVNLEMVAGTPVERTQEVISQLERLALSIDEVASVFSVVGTSFSERGRETAADPATVAQLHVELLSAEERERRGMRSSEDVITSFRRRTGSIAGVRKIGLIAQSGGPQGPDIEIRLRGDDLDQLAAALAHVRSVVGGYSEIYEMEDDLNVGKQEVRLRLRQSAHALGLTTSDLALQVRHALFGFEAQKLQADDEEVKVRVLLPDADRRNLSDLGRLRVVSPSGHRVPLAEVAEVYATRGFASLARVDGKRAATVRAEVDEATGNVDRLTTEIERRLTDISQRFPGISMTFEGQRKETNESLGSLAIGFPAAVLMIYALIAVLFRSYLQPFIVMVAIPFSFIGAVAGHLLMGFEFTLLSLIGCVALAGIVVNDSLILVDYINQLRRQGSDTLQAVVQGARARLRAILLTTITTVLGLAPLMLERSFQAKFLIPMAISIVFGLAFATLLTLLLIPTLYLVHEDFRALFRVEPRQEVGAASDQKSE